MPPAGPSTGRPWCRIVIAGPFTAAGMPIVPFAQDHGYSTTLGFRIGAFAYSTDVTELDDQAFAMLAGIEFWIVDCLRREPHPTHSHLAKTLAWIERVKPRRAVLTHMDHTLDYASSPPNCRRASNPAGTGSPSSCPTHDPRRQPPMIAPRSRPSCALPMPSTSRASASRRARCSTITQR